MQIAAIISGLPGAGAVEIAKACKQKGQTVALLTLSKKQPNDKALPDKVDVADIGSVQVIDADSADAKTKLESAIKDFKGKGLVPVAIDAQPNVSNAALYNSVGLGFVSSATGADVIKATEESKNNAIIGPYLSRDMMALDDMLDSFSRRHRGFFNNHALSVLDDLNTPSLLFNRPLFHRGLFDSFERLFDEELVPSKLVKQDDKFVSGKATTTYSVKDKSTGTATFEFKHAVGDKPIAEAVADAAQLLGDKINEQATARVWPMTSLLDAPWPRIAL